MIIFISMASVELYLFLNQAIKSFLILIRNRGIPQPIPTEVSKLANKMGVKIKDFRIADGMLNAYTTGRKVVIGSRLIEKLEKDELLAIIAHELAHIKENHLTIRLVVVILTVSLGMISWSNLPDTMVTYALLGYITIVLIPVNHWIEHRADKLAGEMVGCESLKSALLKISEGSDIKEPSETHPSIFNRVKFLKPSQ